MPPEPRPGARVRRLLRTAGLAVALYLGAAYGLAPRLWRHYEPPPDLATAPKTTRTPDGLPGDPLNVGFVGTKAQLVRALVAAGWVPADTLSFASSLGIAESVLLRRPDPAAPVSTLLLYGRRQDLAFERTVGGSARQRHHVRLWQAPPSGPGARPTWLGAATFDQGVGVSHRTGQITHHIAPDVDAERDTLVADVERTGRVARVYGVTGVGPTLHGRNGGGDRYVTDGEMRVAVLAGDAAPPAHLPAPPVVRLRNRVWKTLRRAPPHPPSP